jgi:STAS-like domain of unknown function (DUF4325)
MSVTVSIADRTGDFAEDKDLAAEVRETFLRPSLDSGMPVTLDFGGVTLTTQSFVHALISDVLRSRGVAALDLIIFKGCNKTVGGLIETVVQYSLETPPVGPRGRLDAGGVSRRKKGN